MVLQLSHAEEEQAVFPSRLGSTELCRCFFLKKKKKNNTVKPSFKCYLSRSDS